MYCQKCGAGVPDNAKRCPHCKAPCKKTKSPLIGSLLIAIGILLVAISITILFIVIIMPKGKSNDKTDSSVSTPSVSVETSVETSIETSVETSNEPDEKEDEKDSIFDLITGKDKDTDTSKEPDYDPSSTKLQLPSLESYSEGRLIAGEIEEELSVGGYSVTYSAKKGDTAIVECLAEYADLLINEYNFIDTASSSYQDKSGYNCLYRAFTISGASATELDNIKVSVNNSTLTCTICFIKAVNDDDSYIKIYIPENVTFFYDEEIHKRNGY